MSVRKRSVRSITILQVGGSFFGGTETDELTQAIAEVGASANRFLILDLAECRMMNSSALGVLTRAHHEYSSRGGVIKVVGLQRRMENILVLTRLINLFDHYATVEEAMASFAEARATG
jgi:anti-sigma B factor antagonist